eukprot:Skav201332  [mRNA]  locus=scaffold1389:124310:127482:+ [translate_table: standard]
MSRNVIQKRAKGRSESFRITSRYHSNLSKWEAMNSLLVGTWSLISSEEVLSRARRVSQRIQGFLEQSHDGSLSVEELSLLGLKKRVEGLVPSLNFLLAQTLKRDSCVQQVVQNTQDLLFDVCSFAAPSAAEGKSSLRWGGSQAFHRVNEPGTARNQVPLHHDVRNSGSAEVILLHVGIVSFRSMSLTTKLRCFQREVR